jgi:HEPN domain-containing protein
LDKTDNDKILSDFLEYQLPVFDEILAKSHTPLSSRPLAATMDCISYCIVDIKGDTKEDAWKKPWFKDFYQRISEWYSKRYGDAMKMDVSSPVQGIVLIYNTPFKVNVPLVVPQEIVPPMTRWFCWPNEVLEQEDIFGWVENPPNIQLMSTDDRISLENDLRFVATAIRSIRINLMTATKDEKSTNKLAASILSHIEKGAVDMLTLSGSGISSSVWELHMAIEKSLKFLIRQKGHIPSNTHNLIDLIQVSNGLDGVCLDVTLVQDLPSHHEAIRHRYGEAPELAIRDAIENYNHVLTCLKKFSAALSRKIFMNNTRILIRVPPWLQ